MAKWQTAVKASAVLKNIRSKISTKIEAKKKPKKKSSITWGAIFRRINEIVMDHAGDLVTGADKTLDFAAWSVERTSVLILRRKTVLCSLVTVYHVFFLMTSFMIIRSH